MAADTSKEDLSNRTFEHEWVIKDWLNVIKNETLVENTKTEVQCEADKLEYANFLVGMKICSQGQRRFVRFYSKLQRRHYCLHTIEANFVIQTMQNDGIPWQTFEGEAVVVLGSILDINQNVWKFPSPWSNDEVKHLENSDLSLTVKLKITLKNLPAVSLFKSEEFLKASKEEVLQNFADLYGHKLSSDVKILTKDKKELFAHRAVLFARCPVFASMFGSEFLENSTGVINIDDISASIMEILLKYWYSGELLPSWKDKDIIVEFVYAAGKYQLTKILNLLDDILGFDVKASDVDVELLKMVQNLSLKNAETRLLIHIKSKISQVSNGIELLNMFSLEASNLDEKSYAAFHILKEFDSVFSKPNDIDACSRDVQLLALACKIGMKNTENELLKRIVGTVNKMSTADELFALFDLEVPTKDDGSAERGLLVRAKPE